MSRCLIVLAVVALAASTFAADAVKAAETVKKPAAPAPAAPAPAAAAPAPAAVGTGAVPSAAVSCYQCNSASVGQEDCAKTDLESIAKFIKTCPAVPKGTTLTNNNNAVLCRKIELNLKDEVPRVIRECAYTSEHVDGKKRTGSKGISSYFYTCENADGATPCNPASTTATSVAAIIVSAVAMAFRV